MEEKITVHLQLLRKGSHDPICGNEYCVRLFDKDYISDDSLGEADLDGSGKTEFTFMPSDFRSADSPLERFPDLYFRLYKNEKVIYESPVFNDQDKSKSGDFDTREGWQLDLGTFMVSE